MSTTATKVDRMLVNSSNDELRVAIVKENNFLYDLDIERPGQEKKKANIYKGRITRVEPSLEAAFVDYGAKRQGFLPLKEISPEYYSSPFNPEGDERPDIKELVKADTEVLVQVDKDERGSKGAALTTYITLAGCYLVLMPNNPRAGGISRRIEGEERDQLRETIAQLKIIDGMGVIVRTAGIGKSVEDLQWDLDVLVNQWNAIRDVFSDRPAPTLIHQEGDIVIRSIRDNLRRDIDEIIIDDQQIYVKACNYLQSVRPDYVNRVKLYNDSVPLFSRYQIENQIETVFLREVQLPSGASIVIDRTEALVSIDINSAKATSGGDIEETALNINVEAAHEIARQLRLRDLGGLVVIDFIDMTPLRNQRTVESELRNAMRTDRARVQIGRISRFGLLEMSRQRLRTSLGESVQNICPRCEGRGIMRSIQSIGMSILRLLEEEALKENTAELQVQVPVEVATYMLNEKRPPLLEMEQRHGLHILIIPNRSMEMPKYRVDRIRGDRSSWLRRHPSYDLEAKMDMEIYRGEASAKPSAQPVLKELSAPERPTKVKEGLLTRIFKALFGSSKPKQKAKSGHQQRRRHSGSGNRQQHSRGGQRRGGSQQRSGNRGGRGGQQRQGQNRNRNRNQNQSGGGNKQHGQQRRHHNQQQQHGDAEGNQSQSGGGQNKQHSSKETETN